MSFFYRHRVALGFVCLALAVVVCFGVCFFALSRTASERLRLTVVLDAGHGGIDGGVTGTRTGTKESDINLAISRILQEEFEELGFCVIQTRPTEAGLYGAATPGFKRRDMERRAEVIRSSAPAAMISIHQNFFSQASRRGAQVFFREDVPESVTLAALIQTSLNGMPECVRKSQALAGDYFVLNCFAAPSVIVECGFLSNPEDEALLLDGNYRRKLAHAIAQGTLAFLSRTASPLKKI